MQVICGTDSYPANFRAKKYKIKDKFFSKADFQFMMRNLPVPVEEEEIDEMFEFADKDKDGKISYRWVLRLFVFIISIRHWPVVTSQIF